jgi:SAM-dependent methyltransferase
VFAKRLIQPELLDHAPPEIARANLADLVRINTYFGGHSAIRRLLAGTVSGTGRFTLLDVGAASGDTGKIVAELYPQAAVTNLDYSAVNLSKASHPKLVADAFALPFSEHSFDFVLCSLFLHHFQDEQVVQLLSSMYRIARRALLVVDLERHVLPYIFLPLTRPLFKWGQITVHDGVRSVRAAFTGSELRSLAQRAGIPDPVVRAYRPSFRLTLSGAKSNMGAQQNSTRGRIAEPAPGR